MTTDETISNINFGINDAKGRELGCMVAQWSEAGRHYLAVSATRNEKCYGADVNCKVKSPSGRGACSVFDDIYDRDQAAIAYVKNAEARAKKA